MADKDEINGEEPVKPRFGDYKPDVNQDHPGIYDDGSTAAKKSEPKGEGGDAAPSRHDLKEQEGAPGDGQTTAMDNAESSFARQNEAEKSGGGGSGGLFRREGKSGGSRFSRAFNLKTNRRKIAAGVAVTMIGGTGFFGATMLSGPFQVIHFAQQLQKHFKSNEDFGDDRTSKVLLYALAGKGSQNGRLGVGMNKVANNWEARLMKETGMRPVYQEGTRRFVGFEIVDDNKAQKFLGDLGENDNPKLEQTMGKGARISEVGNTGIYNSADNTRRLDSKKRFVDLRALGFNDRRVWIRSVGRATSTNRVASTVGSRALIKRAGVKFHPLNKVKGKVDEKLAKVFEDRRSKDTREGSYSADQLNPDDPNDTDQNGKAVPANPDDVDASDSTKSYIDDFRDSGVYRTARGAAIITGVLCLTKHFGNNVEDYKYTNSYLPQLRLGMRGISAGEQTKSLDGSINYATLKLESNFLYDKVNNTSWTDAANVRAEQGKSGGVPTPKEAQIGSITDKPAFFDAIDSIPGLGAVCSVQNTIGNLPIIKQVSNVAGSVVEGAANVALNRFGTSTDDLMQSALKTVAGKTVDGTAKGADNGSLSMAGSFFAANEQSLGTGGQPLNPQERSELASLEKQDEIRERSQKTMVARYFDPYDEGSVAGAFLDNAPINADQAAHMFTTSFKSVGSSFSSLFTGVFPKARAEGLYDYGVPKFGFSVEEQKRAGFQYEYENPMENAYKIVEPELDSLNAKYGKCFGVTVTTDDFGVHIHQSDDKVNVFKTYNPKSKDYKPECVADVNTDEKFNHYRFYIADAITAVSLNCYEGDDAACEEVGMSNGGGQSDADSAPSEAAAASGDAKELAKQILENSNASFPYTDSAGGNAKQVLESVRDTGKGFTNSSDALAQQNKHIEINPKLLQALADYLKDHKLAINALSNGDHSAGSNHYKGLAVDFDCGIPLDRNAWEKIAGKYGGKNNGEVCPNNKHWHYDFLQ